jgi:hypothetical protein
MIAPYRNRVIEVDLDNRSLNTQGEKLFYKSARFRRRRKTISEMTANGMNIPPIISKMRE